MGSTDSGLAADVRVSATELFLGRGFRSTTVSDIAKSVGIGKGSVYLYWPDKDSLYVDCVRHDVLSARRELCEAVDRDAGTVRIHAMTGALLGLGVRHELAMRLMFSAQGCTQGLRGPAREALARLREDQLSLWGRYVEALWASRMLADDVRAADVNRSMGALFRGLTHCGDEPTSALHDVATRAAVVDMVGRAFHGTTPLDLDPFSDRVRASLRREPA